MNSLHLNRTSTNHSINRERRSVSSPAFLMASTYRPLVNQQRKSMPVVSDLIDLVEKKADCDYPTMMLVNKMKKRVLDSEGLSPRNNGQTSTL